MSKGTKVQKTENSKEPQELSTKNKDKTKEEMDNDVQLKNEAIKSSFRTLIDSAVIIAVITGVLYIVSFFYLKGFYSYYGLIDIEIDLSIFRMLKICLGIIKSILPGILIYALQSLNIVLTKEKPTIGNFFFTLWIWISFNLLIEYAKYINHPVLRILCLIGAVLLVVVFLLFPIIFRLLPEKNKPRILSFLTRGKKLSLSYIYKILAILFSIYLIIDLIPKYGFNEAKVKKDYLYDSTNQRILIYQDNEKAVFLPKNEDDTFEKKYIIISSSELSEIVLEHFEKEIVFAPKIDYLEESPNMQDENLINLTTEIQMDQENIE